MKKKNILLVALMLLMVGVFLACEKNNNGGEKNYYDGTWVCNTLHGDDSIILTIKYNRVDVATSYQETDEHTTYYQFGNGNEFVVREDTLYRKDSNGTLHESRTGFSVTKLSSDSMKLEYLGILDHYYMTISSYLFNRKSD